MTDFKGVIDALARPRGGSIAAGAIVGGLALIAGLAHRAASGRTETAHENTTRMRVDLNEDDAETALRAMIAATVADGIVDAEERRRLDGAIDAANLGLDERRWLDGQLADPPSIDEIARRVNTLETAVQVYTAARLAIELDTLQERQFLKDLAEALDVPRETVQRLEADLDRMSSAGDV